MLESGGGLEVRSRKGGGPVLFIYFISKASTKVALTLLGLEGRSRWAPRIIHHPCHPESARRSRRRNLPSVSTPKLLILKPPFKRRPDGLHSHHRLTASPLGPRLPALRRAPAGPATRLRAPISPSTAVSQSTRTPARARPGGGWRRPLHPRPPLGGRWPQSRGHWAHPGTPTAALPPSGNL